MVKFWIITILNKLNIMADSIETSINIDHGSSPTTSHPGLTSIKVVHSSALVGPTKMYRTTLIEMFYSVVFIYILHKVEGTEMFELGLSAIPSFN